MEFIAVAFRSRAETVKFYEYATSYGVNAEIIFDGKIIKN